MVGHSNAVSGVFRKAGFDRATVTVRQNWNQAVLCRFCLCSHGSGLPLRVSHFVLEMFWISFNRIHDYPQN